MGTGRLRAVRANREPVGSRTATSHVGARAVVVLYDASPSITDQTVGLRDRVVVLCVRTCVPVGEFADGWD